MTVKTLLIEYDDAHGDVMGCYPLRAPAVEVVRCRDCKYFCEGRRDTANGWVDVFVCYSEQWSTFSLMPSHEVEPDGFCAWGEKKGAD